MSLRKKALMILLSVAVIVAMTPMMAFATGTNSEVKTKDGLTSAISKDGTVVLGDDITADITIQSGKKVTLDLNGHTLTGENHNTTSKVNYTNVISAITNHGLGRISSYII